jgi:hypothetical protein
MSVATEGANLMSVIERQIKRFIDTEIEIADVKTDDTMLWITLTDGRVIGSPLAWSSRLAQATPAQRAQWRLSPNKTGIHWPDIDEDISARVLMGHPS